MTLSQRVKDLNLECIAFKVAYDEGWSLDKVDRAEFYYRCFLQAILDHPDNRLAPTMEIDHFWHHHILDTQKYMEDCDHVLGYYLHHFPYSGIRSDQDDHEQKRRSEISLTLIESIAKRERNENAENYQQIDFSTE
ncbi:glycine-rich domain-containing protein [Bremerella sp. T1]|uniref:glycine-rich domain-containing protein n=1 Tax=Bremerella sp. TYQ1 TaxID=3119568 RepID=UPI001CCC9D72|nr:hypothetical protein [Bremerella volcania]UBM36636.1 hypothetical protein LA756_01740 [Bremerella volcania]